MAALLRQPCYFMDGALLNAATALANLTPLTLSTLLSSPPSLVWPVVLHGCVPSVGVGRRRRVCARCLDSVESRLVFAIDERAAPFRWEGPSALDAWRVGRGEERRGEARTGQERSGRWFAVGRRGALQMRLSSAHMTGWTNLHGNVDHSHPPRSFLSLLALHSLSPLCSRVANRP